MLRIAQRAIPLQGKAPTKGESVMQAKSRVRITAKNGQVYEATANVNGRTLAIIVKGKNLMLDGGKVESVTLEQRSESGKITSVPCSIAANGLVRVKSTTTRSADNDLTTLAPVPSATARQAAIPAFGAPKPVKPGVVHVPYDRRAVASLSRNEECKGWELRLRKADQLTPEQLAELHAAGWRWYGGRLQAFCLAEKNVKREALTIAQALVAGFNSGALHKAQELASFAAGVASGAVQGSALVS